MQAGLAEIPYGGSIYWGPLFEILLDTLLLSQAKIGLLF